MTRHSCTISEKSVLRVESSILDVSKMSKLFFVL